MHDCRKIQFANDPALAAVKHIYEQTFPASERKPTSCFDEMIGREDYAVIIAEIEMNVAGFAVVFIPRSSNDAALLEYLAVDANHRSQGLGSGLVKQAIEIAGERPMLVEVESANDELSVRRRDFYRRNGFSTIADFPYKVPLPNAPPAELMVANAAEPLPRNDLVRWVETIYWHVYERQPRG